VILCKTYNFIMTQFFVPVWCAVLRPTIYGVLQALQSIVGFFDSSAGGKIAAIAQALAMGDGGDIGNINKCMGSLRPRLDCEIICPPLWRLAAGRTPQAAVPKVRVAVRSAVNQRRLFWHALGATHVPRILSRSTNP
jgi:hypothetical protein